MVSIIIRFKKWERVLRIVFLLLLLSTTFSLYFVRPSSYGGSRTLLESDEIEVFSYNDIPMYGDQFRISVEVEIEPVEFWLVPESSYNYTSGLIPDSYFLYGVIGNSSFSIYGPLQRMFIVVLSEIDQWIHVQSWIYPPSAQFSEMAFFPLLISTCIFGFIIILTKIERPEKEN